MTLEEFVKRTLLEITNGVSAAQLESLVYIAPGTVENETVLEPSLVNFEVSVTVNEDAGGAITIWTVGDLKAGASSEHTNRVSFGVPVYFQAPTARNPKHFSLKEKQGDR